MPTRLTVWWLLQGVNIGDSVSPHAVSVRMPDSDEDSDKGLCHQEHDVSSGVLFHTTWCLLVQRKWEERRHLSPLGSETLLQAVCVQKFPVDRITLVNQDELDPLTNTVHVLYTICIKQTVSKALHLNSCLLYKEQNLFWTIVIAVKKCKHMTP